MKKSISHWNPRERTIRMAIARMRPAKAVKEEVVMMIFLRMGYLRGATGWDGKSWRGFLEVLENSSGDFTGSFSVVLLRRR